MKKTVFHMVRSNCSGGLENVYLDYCEILHEDFNLICITSGKYVHLDKIRKLGKVEILGFRGLRDLFSIIKFGILFRKYSPDLIISHHGKPFPAINLCSYVG